VGFTSHIGAVGVIGQKKWSWEVWTVLHTRCAVRSVMTVRWVFSCRLKIGSDEADLMFWGSLFQTEAAATTKTWSPTEERRVAGMASNLRMMLVSVGVFGWVHWFCCYLWHSLITYKLIYQMSYSSCLSHWCCQCLLPLTSVFYNLLQWYSSSASCDTISWDPSSVQILLISFPDHSLPNCFRFLVLYTVYSSGSAVSYLSTLNYSSVM